MSAENQLNPADPNATQAIETVYTTIESQPDQTDWLTVVSNLRQINRQLVEQIARLEQALASAKQSMHTYKEEKQTHEITILQQQDELRLVNERVGGLFQQLETSHQIGQRQQTLIETISQQLEITQAIVPQLEAENTELQQKIQQQQQKLAKTEQVALELHRRMKHKTTPAAIEVASATTAEPAAIIPPASPEMSPTEPQELVATSLQPEPTTTANPPAIESTPVQPDPATPELVTVKLEPPTPAAEMSVWTPTPPTNPTRSNWRDAIESSKNPQSGDDLLTARFPSPTLTPTPPAEVVNKESTAPKEPTTNKPTPNWPAPTVDRRVAAEGNVDLPSKKTAIDLPKFPKRNK
jgi:hypothetical protein